MPAGGVHGDSYWWSPPPPSQPHLLEVTVISAQDLRCHPGQKVRPYAVAWADGAQKQRTDVNHGGGSDPTWNDTFVFSVDASFLRSDTATLTVEVRSARRFCADRVLGRAGLVLSTFVCASRGSSSSSPGAFTGRLVAVLQLRHPQTLQPQGVVNVAVAVLDAEHARTMPIYSAPDSPDAFSVKRLGLKRPASLGKIAEDYESELELDSESQQSASSEGHSGPIEPKGGGAVEQRKLEQTLKKWKEDLSPDIRTEGTRGGRAGDPASAAARTGKGNNRPLIIHARHHGWLYGRSVAEGG